MSKILFVNACVREESRTKALADYILSKISGEDSEVIEVELQKEDLKPLTRESLLLRDQLVAGKAYSDPMFYHARMLAKADLVVIAAPFWDFSFPALLKTYVERVMVSGLTFDYNEKDEPVGLCRAKKLIYVTTAGGPIYSEEFGYGYIRDVAKIFWGIPETVCFKAENLDIRGAKVDCILEDTRKQIDKRL